MVSLPGGFGPTPRSLTLLAPPALRPYAADAASRTVAAASDAVGSAPRKRLRSGGGAALRHSTQISWRSSSAAPHSPHWRTSGAGGGGGGGGIAGSLTADQFRNTSGRCPLRVFLSPNTEDYRTLKQPKSLIRGKRAAPPAGLVSPAKRATGGGDMRR